MMPYETRVSGNTILVTLGRGQAAPAAPASAAAVTGASVAAATSAASIQKVDFRRGADGAGRVIVNLSDSNVQASLRQEGGRIVVDFPRTAVPDQYAQRYDVVDFATPVNSFDVTRTPVGARIVVAAGGDYEQLAWSDGSMIRSLVDGAAYLFSNDYEAALIQQKTGWDDAEVRRRVGVRVTTHGAKGAVVDLEDGSPVRVAATIVSTPPLLTSMRRESSAIAVSGRSTASLAGLSIVNVTGCGAGPSSTRRTWTRSPG
jgi:hypothetical protein